MRTINIVSIHSNTWLRQFPDSIPRWDNWHFIFNATKEDYDYLVVFDDCPDSFALRCPQKNTIHLMTEPPFFGRYHKKFLRQFSWRVKVGAEKAKSGDLYQQPGLNWHVGWRRGEEDINGGMKFNELKKLFYQPKSKMISAIASSLCNNSFHQKRVDFVQRLKQYYGPSLDHFGHGFVDMDDKIVALQDYRFHIVLENSSYDHYFTEKLSDCFLAGCYPLYYGCPNLAQYFPQSSYVHLDIDDFQNSIKKINRAIEEEWDQKFKKELLEARNLVLYEHNLFPMLIKLISGIEKSESKNKKRAGKKVSTLKSITQSQSSSRATRARRIYRRVKKNLSWL